MKKNMFGVLVFVCSFICIQPYAIAHDHQSRTACACGVWSENMMKTFKLDEAQMAKIKGIKEQLKTSLQSSQDQLKTLRGEINQQVQSEHMDTSKLDALIHKKVQLMGMLIKEKSIAKHQIYELLNAKQKVEYQHMPASREEKLEHKFHSCHEE